MYTYKLDEFLLRTPWTFYFTTMYSVFSGNNVWYLYHSYVYFQANKTTNPTLVLTKKMNICVFGLEFYRVHEKHLRGKVRKINLVNGFILNGKSKIAFCVHLLYKGLREIVEYDGFTTWSRLMITR